MPAPSWEKESKGWFFTFPREPRRQSLSPFTSGRRQGDRPPFIPSHTCAECRGGVGEAQGAEEVRGTAGRSRTSGPRVVGLVTVPVRCGWSAVAPGVGKSGQDAATGAGKAWGRVCSRPESSEESGAEKDHPFFLGAPASRRGTAAPGHWDGVRRGLACSGSSSGRSLALSVAPGLHGWTPVPSSAEVSGPSSGDC